jgi:predicted TIM-barrel fold metal-dependent hydrolase
MPIYIHVGFPSPALGNIFGSLFTTINLGNPFGVFAGFAAIVGGGVAERFPRLKFAFVEAGCEWLPWLMHQLEGNWKLSKANGRVGPVYGISGTDPREIVRNGNIYVVMEPEDDLRGAMELMGDDHIMIGSDMPHVESHPDSQHAIQEREDLSLATKEKILSENALRYFGSS